MAESVSVTSFSPDNASLPASITDYASDSFRQFAEMNFQGQPMVPVYFARNDLRQPLLRITPDTEKKASIAVWKTLLRFMGDQTDYRAGLEKSSQPDLGPVMNRLYGELGIQLSPRDSERINLIGEMNGNEKDGKGTVGRLHATISKAFSKKKTRKGPWSQLPIEETIKSPLGQIHFIVGYGILRPQIRDEIYCQICKQLTKNPFKQSVARGWLLMLLCLGCFPPSNWLIGTLKQFLQEGPPIYAVNCRKLLIRILGSGARFQPPSHVEMEAGLQKKLVEVPITLMDGTQHLLHVDSVVTSEELTKKLAEKVKLKDTFGYSLFISMYNQVASLGSGRDYVMDSISQCEQIYRDQEMKEGPAPWRLFFRKEIFSPWEDPALDPVSCNLIFSQIVRGIILGEYVCEDDDELARLASQQYYTEYGADMSDGGLKALLPSYIPEALLGDNDRQKQWRKKILKIHKKTYTDKKENDRPSAEKIKEHIVLFAKERWQSCFSRFFDVEVLEGLEWSTKELTLAINNSGVFITGEKKNETLEINLMSVSSLWEPSGSEGDILMFLLVDGGAYKFSSIDCEEIKKLILYLIEGLRQRSKYAIAVEEYTGENDQELSIKEGDLMILNKVAEEAALTKTRCIANNRRTGKVGILDCDTIYVLPTLTMPPEEILELFAKKKHQVQPLEPVAGPSTENTET